MTGLLHSWGREIPCPACGPDGCQLWQDDPPRSVPSERIPALIFVSEDPKLNPEHPLESFRNLFKRGDTISIELTDLGGPYEVDLSIKCSRCGVEASVGHQGGAMPGDVLSVEIPTGWTPIPDGGAGGTAKWACGDCA